MNYIGSKLKLSSWLEEEIKKIVILIGIRNYTTGISLEGEHLERLFLLRLPYPVFTSKKWLDLKYRSGKDNAFWWLYTNEMIISLRQAMGRLQRTFEDKGVIHIMDSRIFDRSENDKKYKILSLKETIWMFASEYGVIKNDTYKKKEKSIIDRITVDELDWL